MGGINLGDIFARLDLDNADYLKTIKDTEAAHQILKLSFDGMNKTLLAFISEMDKVGVSADKVIKSVQSANAAGGDFNDTYKKITATLAAAQTQLLEFQAVASRNIKSIDVGNEGKLAQAYYADLLHMDRTYQEQEALRAVAEKEALDFQEAEESAMNKRRLERNAFLIEQDKVRTRVAIADIEAQEAAYLRMQEAETAAASGGGGARFGLRASTSGIRPTGFLGGAGAIGGVVAGFALYESIKQAAEFQDALAKVDVLIGQVSDDLNNKMGKAAKDLAAEFGLDATEVVSQFGAMAKAGLDTEQRFAVLPEITKLAFGTGNDLNQTFKQTLTVMNAMGVPISRVAEVTNLLAFANKNARGSVEDVARAMEGKAAGAFREYGLTLNEVVALTIALEKRGIDAGVAQTALTQIITKINASGRDHANILVTIGDKTKRWGDVVHDSGGNMRHLADILQDLDSSFEGKSTEAIDKFFKMIGIGGQRDIYVKSLIGLSDEIRRWGDQSKKSFVEVQKATDTMLESPIVKFKQLRSEVANLGIDIGNLGLVVASQLKGPLSAVLEWLDKAISKSAQLVNTGVVGILASIVGGPSFAGAMGAGAMMAPPDQGANPPRPTAQSNRTLQVSQIWDYIGANTKAKGSDNTPLAVDPDAEEKARKKAVAAQVYLDNTRTAFARFAESASADSEKFGDSTNAFVQKMLNDINAMFAAGSDPKLIRAAISQDSAVLRGLSDAAKARVEDIKLTDKSTEATYRLEQAESRTAITMLRGIEDSNKAQQRFFDDQKKSSEGVEQFKVFGTPQEQLTRGGRSDLAQKLTETQQLNQAYKQLGLTMDFETGAATQRLVVDFNKVVDSSKDLGTVEQAWSAIGSTLNRLAKTDMKLVLDEYDKYIAKLQSLNAPEGEILKIQQQRLQTEIEMMALSGTDATSQIVQANSLGIKYQLLQDKSKAIGTATTQAFNTLTHSFETLGVNVAQGIFQAKSFHDIWQSTIKSIGSQVTTTLFGLFGKLLDNWILDLIGFGTKAAGVQTTAAVTQAAIWRGVRVSEVVGEQAVAGARAMAAYADIPFGGFELGVAAAGEFVSAIAAYLPFASARGGMDVGANNVLAMLHPREMVLPGNLAENVRSGGISSSGHSGPLIDMRGSTFSGVTQTLVNDVMERAVVAARIAGSRFSPVG